MTDARVGFFRDSDDVSFKSAFGLAESVQRLRAATRASAGFATEQAAVGRVQESEVHLERFVSMVRNSFRPHFTGRFEQRGDAAYLTGRFALPWAARIFMGLWLVMVLVIGMPISLWAHGGPALIPIGMLAAGAGIVRLGLWMSRNDPAWLSGVIEGALGTPASGFPVQPLFVAQPIELRIAALFFAVLGAASIASPFAPWHRAPGEQTPPARWLLWNAHPELSVVYGLCLLAIAAGIYRQQLWAWRLGLAVLALTAVQAVVAVADPLAPLPVRLFSGAAALVVAANCTGWWWAQRRHFRRAADPLAG